jgi:hypothetical protein
MNRVFAAKLDNPTYTYDNEGHLHVPPLQPGRLPPAISPPPGSESDTTAAIAQAPSPPGSGIRNFFGGLFASRHDAEPPAANMPAPVQTANAGAIAPKPRQAVHQSPAAAAALRPKSNEPAKSEPAKPEPAVAQTATPAPQQQAAAFAPPPGGNGLISGAQPVMPAGSFNSRWGIQ